MAQYNQLLMPEKIVYGQGAFAELGHVATTLGYKALIVSDPAMESIGLVKQCEAYLKAADRAFVTYTGVAAEPTDQFVDEALRLCREEQCDMVVAIGGGSCIDTAKAVAVMMTNEGYIGDYVGGQRRFTHPALPLIAIPSTAGTGSEVTKVTVIINTKTDVKMMLSQPELMPWIALVDPMLTLSCPPSVTAATGVDALCHAIEAFLSRRAHPLTNTLALDAIIKIMHNLPTAYRDGSDLEAREQMAIGSMMAGAAFSNASVTLVHGMSRPIGALFHVPHGISNAMLLLPVMEFTRSAAEAKMANIGRILSPSLLGSPDQEAAQVFIDEIKQLVRTLEIPNLKTWGIDEQKFNINLPKMVADAMDSGSPGNNPKIPTSQELTELYQLCYGYQL
jgi:alcohol dehydrogenase class IV